MSSASGDKNDQTRGRVRLSDVARLAGVGTSVASRVLNADPTVRARRRQVERPDIGGDALATDLRLRDQSDAARMRPADDADQIDTTDLQVEDVVTRIEELVQQRLAASRP